MAIQTQALSWLLKETQTIAEEKNSAELNELLKAISENDLNTVAELVEYAPKCLLEKDSRGWNALMYAISLGRSRIAIKLLEINGAKQANVVSRQTGTLISPISLALGLDLKPVIKALLGIDTQPSILDQIFKKDKDQSESLFMRAVSRALQSNANLASKDKDSMTVSTLVSLAKSENLCLVATVAPKPTYDSEGQLINWGALLDLSKDALIPSQEKGVLLQAIDMRDLDMVKVLLSNHAIDQIALANSILKEECCEYVKRLGSVRNSAHQHEPKVWEESRLQSGLKTSTKRSYEDIAGYIRTLTLRVYNQYFPSSQIPASIKKPVMATAVHGSGSGSGLSASNPISIDQPMVFSSGISTRKNSRSSQKSSLNSHSASVGSQAASMEIDDSAVASSLALSRPRRSVGSREDTNMGPAQIGKKSRVTAF
jgi:hypothetical protein